MKKLRLLNIGPFSSSFNKQPYQIAGGVSNTSSQPLLQPGSTLSLACVCSPHCELHWYTWAKQGTQEAGKTDNLWSSQLELFHFRRYSTMTVLTSGCGSRSVTKPSFVSWNIFFLKQGTVFIRFGSLGYFPPTSLCFQQPLRPMFKHVSTDEQCQKKYNQTKRLN